MSLRKYYRIIYRMIYQKINPVKYARKIGVNMGGNYIFTVMFLGLQNLGL